MKNLVRRSLWSIPVLLLLAAPPLLAGEHDEHGHAGGEGSHMEMNALDEGHDHGMHASEAGVPAIHPVIGEGGVIELNNEQCLVSGEAVSGEHFYTHGGVNYAFCCNMCIRDFKKNPEKFALPMDVIHKAMGRGGHTH